MGAEGFLTVTPGSSQHARGGTPLPGIRPGIRARHRMDDPIPATVIPAMRSRLGRRRRHDAACRARWATPYGGPPAWRNIIWSPGRPARRRPGELRIGKTISKYQRQRSCKCSSGAPSVAARGSGRLGNRRVGGNFAGTGSAVLEDRQSQAFCYAHKAVPDAKTIDTGTYRQRLADVPNG